jgi:hypothetical protein
MVICMDCRGKAKVIACIEGQSVIDKTLNHLEAKGALPPPPDLLSAARASPNSGWFA